MEKLGLDDTIAAISTPIGKSGIGIVRLSGRGALSVADKLFVSAEGGRPSQFASHTLHYGWIGDIDEVLLGVMRAPRTYTREDIVEINCHSGITVLKKILDLVLKQGVRLASPGEFTKRAYLSGRIDLAQAEAVLDVINSQTEQALKLASGQLRGRLSGRIKSLRQNLLDILSRLELAIDFADQDIQPLSQKELLNKMQKLASALKELLDSADKGAILRQGISCAICGKTNVGKSSLLNAVLKQERAIVTSIAGTTRDTLEETVDLSGIPLRLIDTAGIVKGQDLPDREAVKRSRKCIQEASLVLFVLDASRRLSSQDAAISRYICGKPAIVVLNKQDLPPRINMNKARQILPGRGVVQVSALDGSGLDRLKRELADFIWQGEAASNGQVLVSNLRHKQALSRAHRFLRQAIKAAQQGQGTEIIALEVKAAQACLAEIVGRVDSADVLERIFSQFCIGK